MADLVPLDPLALAPNPDGRSLRTATGNAIWKLVPPRARPLAKVLTALPVGLLVSGLIGMSLFSGSGFVWWMLIGKGSATKLGFLAAAAAGMARFSARLVRWQLRRLSALHVTVASLRGCPPGSLVRVVGRVRAEAAFPAAVSGQPAVLAHYEVRPDSGTSSHQIRGVDFYLDVDGPEAVRVAVEHAYFDDGEVLQAARPANPAVFAASGRDALYRESRLGPGDRVEAVGVLVREVDPSLPAGPGRAPALRIVLQASPRLPLLLRKLPEVEGPGSRAEK